MEFACEFYKFPRLHDLRANIVKLALLSSSTSGEVHV